MKPVLLLAVLLVASTRLASTAEATRSRKLQAADDKYTPPPVYQKPYYPPAQVYPFPPDAAVENSPPPPSPNAPYYPPPPSPYAPPNPDAPYYPPPPSPNAPYYPPPPSPYPPPNPDAPYYPPPPSPNAPYYPPPPPPYCYQYCANFTAVIKSVNVTKKYNETSALAVQGLVNRLFLASIHSEGGFKCAVTAEGGINCEAALFSEHDAKAFFALWLDAVVLWRQHDTISAGCFGALTSTFFCTYNNDYYPSS